MNKQNFDPLQALRDVQNFGEEGGVVPVIDVAATSTFLNPADMEKSVKGDIRGCYLYSRHSNPTVQYFSKKVAAMENTEAALGLASGMAAIATTLEHLCPSGSHIVCSRVIYGGTYALMKEVLPRRGVTVDFVDFRNPAEIESKIRPNTKVIYGEVMSNPLLEICDLEEIARIKKKHNLKLVIDNTFTPLMVSPANWGADFIIHSCTKFMSGSSDLLAGVIACSRADADAMVDLNTGSLMVTGAIMDSRIAHELYTRLDHLGLRMAAHSEAAAFFAGRMLESGISVQYPGLSSHPGNKVLKKLMNPGFGYGAMLLVDCGERDRAMKLATELQARNFGLYAVSLGFSRTLISCPSTSTSSEVPDHEQKEMGITPGLLRVSVGYVGSREVLWGRFLDAARTTGILK